MQRMMGGFVRVGLLLGGSILVFAAGPGLAPPSRASERELTEGPAPSNADRIETPLERAFLAPARKQPLISSLSDRLDELPPFFADARLEARFRTYYLRKDRTIDELSEAWAMGGSLYFHSGWLKDALAFEAEWFTSQPIVAEDSRDGTLLLDRGQDGYEVAGIVNAKLRYQGFVLTGYRQYLGLPYINENDSRMTPQTYEALTLSKSDGKIRLSGGYIWQTKRRNDDRFVSMAEALGVSKERGVAYGSVLWHPSDAFYAGLSVAVLPEIVGGGYAETGYRFEVPADWSLRLDGQATYQQGDGQLFAGLAGGSYETWSTEGRISAGWKGLLFRMAVAITADERAIISPYGSSPSFLSLMQRDFTQRDEKALLLSLSYDFSTLGLTDLSAIVNFAQGWDARVLDRRGDAREVDVTLDYRIPPEWGWYEGLWLRLRGSWLDDDRASRDGTDFRVIFRYDFPVL